ncbi:rap1 GTPase-GDP dissociation stimulator 1-A [Eucyclogobius newberryi]|uniref:rap1 GTPase-GDP dissociation stimulator 1-A n=1 Tax=Eucyclogobius newberryi TaxID=166745 RepID=UPI003B5C0158
MARPDLGLKKRSRDRANQNQNQLLCTKNDNLNNALGAIRVLGLDLLDKELQPHLTTVLNCIRDKHGGAPEQVVVSGVLPVLALNLRNRGSQAVLTARLVSALANNSLVRKGFGDSGLVPALISVLSSPDQDLLIHSATALSRMCYDSSRLQDQCLRCGAVPRLVSILFRFSERPLLEEACLLALCNLSGLGLSEEVGVVWERGVAMRPGECTFTGSAPLKCGWAGSWVTVVKVCQLAPGQFSVNMDVMRRCSPRFWGSLEQTPQKSLFSVVRTGSSVYRVLKHWNRNRTRTKSLKTRMFHTFL